MRTALLNEPAAGRSLASGFDAQVHTAHHLTATPALRAKTADAMQFASTVARSLSAAGIRRVLVVDDFAVFRAGIRRSMSTDDGPAWLEASSLAEALRLTADASPDLVLLDLNLPDSRGLATLLTARRAFAHAPIVVIVGSVMSEQNRDGLRMAGSAGTLPRDADELTLAMTLRAAVATHDGWQPMDTAGPGASPRPQARAPEQHGFRSPCLSCS